MRSYDDPCGIARALDRIGERWALLVVRELLLGPKRFADLKRGLPELSPNVLSQRLRELEEQNVVARRPLPPPANATVYELTAWGKELEPVILALARWGSRAMPMPAGELSADALMIALQTTFDPEAAEGLRAQLEVHVGPEVFAVNVTPKRVEIERGECKEPDAIIAAPDTTTLRRVAFGRQDLRQARRAGELGIEGDERTAEQFLSSFRRPIPATV